MSFEAQGVFAGSGSVGRYWQTRCRGFEARSARGRRLGIVAALEFDRKTGAVAVLLVRRRRRKPLRVRPESVAVVDPWRRLLVVELPRRRPPSVRTGRFAGRAGRASVASANTLARGSGRAAHELAWRSAWALAWAFPRVLFAVGLAAWLYAVAVWALVRAVVWLLAALTAGTARGGARLKPHLHGAK